MGRWVGTRRVRREVGEQRVDASRVGRWAIAGAVVCLITSANRLAALRKNESGNLANPSGSRSADRLLPSRYSGRDGPRRQEVSDKPNNQIPFERVVPAEEQRRQPKAPIARPVPDKFSNDNARRAPAFQIAVVSFP